MLFESCFDTSAHSLAPLYIAMSNIVIYMHALPPAVNFVNLNKELNKISRLSFYHLLN